MIVFSFACFAVKKGITNTYKCFNLVFLKLYTNLLGQLYFDVKIQHFSEKGCLR